MKNLLRVLLLLICLASIVHADTPFVTEVTRFDGLRNDFTGGVGFEFVTGTATITVTQLGRWVVAGNSQSHVVEIMDASGTVLASATVNTSGAASGQFTYSALSSPVTLSASTSYYILSNESSGGDQWYNNNTDVTTTSVATNAGPAYYDGSLHAGDGSPRSYVPVNFQYLTGGGGGPNPGILTGEFLTF